MVVNQSQTQHMFLNTKMNSIYVQCLYWDAVYYHGTTFCMCETLEMPKPYGRTAHHEDIHHQCRYGAQRPNVTHNISQAHQFILRCHLKFVTEWLDYI